MRKPLVYNGLYYIRPALPVNQKNDLIPIITTTYSTFPTASTFYASIYFWEFWGEGCFFLDLAGVVCKIDSADRGWLRLIEGRELSASCSAFFLCFCGSVASFVLVV